MDRRNCKTLDDFHSLVKESHHLPADMPFTISYTDPRNGDLLPITNDENLQRAFTTAMPLLRLFIYREAGEAWTMYHLCYVMTLHKTQDVCTYVQWM